MIRTRIEVRNMACEMCEAHVIEAVRGGRARGGAGRGGRGARAGGGF